MDEVRRISEHEPRKGTETVMTDRRSPWPKYISEHELRKGTETRCRRSCYDAAFLISEHEPRKGTETGEKKSRILPRCAGISEHEPRKGTEIGYDFLLMKSQPVVYVLSLQCILLILN